MKVFLILVTLCISVIILIVGTNKTPRSINRLITNCLNEKPSLLEDPTSYITFSPIPTQASNKRYWYVNWKGLHVPLPDIEYTTLYYAENKSIALLSKPEKMTIHFRLSSLPNIQVNYNPFSFNNTEAVSSINSFIQGYNVTPDDLNCLSLDINKTAKALLGLFYKTFDSTLTAAYQINENSLITLSRLGKYTTWRVNKYEASGNTLTTYIVSYLVPPESKHAEIGLAINPVIATNVQKKPEWVNKLQIAFNSMKKSNLIKFAKESDIEFVDNTVSSRALRKKTLDILIERSKIKQPQ